MASRFPNRCSHRAMIGRDGMAPRGSFQKRGRRSCAASENYWPRTWGRGVRIFAMVIGPWEEMGSDGQPGFEFLFEDSYVVAAGAQSPWARRRRIALAQLINEQWVLPPLESPIGLV